MRAEEIASRERGQAFPASRYLEVKEAFDRDIVAALKEGADYNEQQEDQQEEEGGVVEEPASQPEEEEVVFNEDEGIEEDLDGHDD